MIVKQDISVVEIKSATECWIVVTPDSFSY